MKRRSFLKGTLATGAAAVAVNAGLLTPNAVLAADWNSKAFNAKTTDDALNSAFGSASAADSGDIKLKAPAIAENGAVVNVAVSSTLPAESISIFVEQNSQPLATSFNMSDTTAAFLKTRVKVAKSSKLIAVVKSGGKLYSTTRDVKVTLGGCGG